MNTERPQGQTTIHLSRPSPLGDRMIDEAIMARGEIERFVRFIRRLRLYPDLANDLIIACEKARHQDNIDHWQMYSMLKEGQLWPKYPLDPISFPDKLPREALSDERFDPMCPFCRDRYKL